MDLDFLCSLDFADLLWEGLELDSDSFAFADLLWEGLELDSDFFAFTNLSSFILSWIDRRISQLFLNFTKNLMAKYPPNTDMIAMKILDASLV